jgi:hypothetical protein
LVGEIDATEWEAEGEEALGTKPKVWLREPSSSTPWLFKHVTFNQTPTGSYAKGDDWAERAVGLVADAIGVPTARTELAFRINRGIRDNGVLVRTVVEPAGAELVHGNELLARLGLTIERPLRVGYTLANVRRSLEGVSAPPLYRDHFSGWDVFIGYLILDALCGNTDRHEENWAILRSDTDELALSFDHASSLGFLLPDSERLERLTTSDGLRRVDSWAGRATTPFEGKPHPVELAVHALQTVDASARDFWVEAVAQLDPDPLVDEIPAKRISDPSRAFARAILRTNRDRILSYA